MRKEERRYLELQGFKEDRSYFHTWSKSTSRAQVFQDQGVKRYSYFTFEVMEEKEGVYRVKVDLSFEVEGSISPEDFHCARLFTIRSREVAPLIERAYSLLNEMVSSMRSSLGQLKNIGI